MFITEDFRIVDIKQNLPPCVTEICPNYSSKFAAKYVLEVNSGFVKMNDIEIGDLVTWTPKV
ncbi:MAG: DUF192 domain-containing protein [Nitrosopumilus sp.]|nr:DUF192 domain-containing protein [Nitrosopumilus sp.]